MTTLNFNRKEKLSRIEMMLVANLIDNVLSYETSVSSSLMNKLSGIYDGYLYSFSQELEVFENEVKVGNFENKFLKIFTVSFFIISASPFDLEVLSLFKSFSKNCNDVFF